MENDNPPPKKSQHLGQFRTKLSVWLPAYFKSLSLEIFKKFYFYIPYGVAPCLYRFTWEVGINEY